MAKMPRKTGPTTESGGGPSAGGAGAGRGAWKSAESIPPRSPVSRQNSAAKTYITQQPKSAARVENGRAAMQGIRDRAYGAGNDAGKRIGVAKGLVGGAVLGAGAQRELDKKNGASPSQSQASRQTQKPQQKPQQKPTGSTKKK